LVSVVRNHGSDVVSTASVTSKVVVTVNVPVGSGETKVVNHSENVRSKGSVRESNVSWVFADSVVKSVSLGKNVSLNFSDSHVCLGRSVSETNNMSFVDDSSEDSDNQLVGNPFSRCVESGFDARVFQHIQNRWSVDSVGTVINSDTDLSGSVTQDIRIVGRWNSCSLVSHTSSHWVIVGKVEPNGEGCQNENTKTVQHFLFLFFFLEGGVFLIFFDER